MKQSVKDEIKILAVVLACFFVLSALMYFYVLPEIMEMALGDVQGVI